MSIVHLLTESSNFNDWSLRCTDKYTLPVTIQNDIIDNLKKLCSKLTDVILNYKIKESNSLIYNNTINVCNSTGDCELHVYPYNKNIYYLNKLQGIYHLDDTYELKLSIYPFEKKIYFGCDTEKNVSSYLFYFEKKINKHVLKYTNTIVHLKETNQKIVFEKESSIKKFKELNFKIITKCKELQNKIDILSIEKDNTDEKIKQFNNVKKTMSTKLNELDNKINWMDECNKKLLEKGDAGIKKAGEHYNKKLSEKDILIKELNEQYNKKLLENGNKIKKSMELNSKKLSAKDDMFNKLKELNNRKLLENDGMIQELNKLYNKTRLEKSDMIKELKELKELLNKQKLLEKDSMIKELNESHNKKILEKDCMIKELNELNELHNKKILEKNNTVNKLNDIYSENEYINILNNAIIKDIFNDNNPALTENKKIEKEKEEHLQLLLNNVESLKYENSLLYKIIENKKKEYDLLQQDLVFNKN
jgi:hypothetical protein